MDIYTLLAIPVVVFVAWYYTAGMARTGFPMLRNKRIVLLIAHPDDEAMFFAPTVLTLTRPEMQNHFRILCLSNGNADGLGAVREKEIKRSAFLLGIKSETDVMVHDSPSFPDSMKETWSSSAISDLLNEQFTKNTGSKAKGSRSKGAASSVASEPAIDVLLTFDRQGVSSHPNHCSLYHGARAWVQSLAAKSGLVAMYTLTSVNISRKYAGVFDAPWTMVSSVVMALRSKDRELPDRIAVISDPARYWIAREAMTQAHRSQMVWFRWGWITLGRYMVVNDLKRERP